MEKRVREQDDFIVFETPKNSYLFSRVEEGELHFAGYNSGPNDEEFLTGADIRRKFPEIEDILGEYLDEDVDVC